MDRATVASDQLQNALRTWSMRTRSKQEDINQRCKAWEVHTLPEAKHGDLALSRGLTAAQIAVIRVGCNTDNTTSHAHELVVVQLNLEDLLPQKRASLETRVTRVRAALHNLLPRLVA